MSLISKQINDLRAYAKDRKGELAKLVSDAADTIEELSAKLSAANMERSSQYYHGGWIPISEKFPQEDEDVLLQFPSNQGVGYYEDGDWMINTGDGIFCMIDYNEEKPIAWMPLPEPFGGDKNE